MNNTINADINQIATDMNNMASDTQQSGTGIGQSSPNIDLNAGQQQSYDRATEKSYSQAYNEWKDNEEWDTKTHGNIMSDIQKYESELDKINEVQELFRNNKITEAMKLAKQLDININDYKENQEINLENGFMGIANLLDPRKSELLDSIKKSKEHGSFDNRTDEQRRSDKLLEEQREREDTTAQRGTQDMLKAGLHPASANYGGSVGGSSGGGGGGSGSESEKEKERRRRRKKYLEEKRREREKEKRQNIINVLSRMGSAATIGAMRNTRTKSMNNPTITNNQSMKKSQDSPEWLGEYMNEIKAMKPANRNEYNNQVNKLKDKYNL